MSHIDCQCGERIFIGDAPTGARVRCRTCGRITDLAEAKRADDPVIYTRRRRRRTLKGLPSFVPSALAIRVRDLWTSASRRRRTRSVAGSPWKAAATHPIGIAVILYTMLMVLAAVYLRAEGDESGVGMLLLFGPRWWLLLPWIALAPLTLVGRRKRMLLVAVAGATLTLFGVVGFEVPNPTRPQASRHALRLITYNTDRLSVVATYIRQDISRWGADVVLLQDCASSVVDSLRAISTVHLHETTHFCMVSLAPTESVEEMPHAFGIGADSSGNSGHMIRYDVHTQGGVVPIYSIHLESPREALWAARRLDFGQLSNSVIVRGADSRRASSWVRRVDSAFVVAGDFNLPTGSRILNRDWGDLTDAFSEAGFGFGHTMFAGHYSVRIDHALLSAGLVVEAIEVEHGFPSEHQPIIVDIGWR